jgi:hypothetical protein
LTPLYHSASLLRALTTGQVNAGQLVDLAYLIAMFVLCSALTIRLMRRRLIT